MSDLISRQAAIDIVEFECGEWIGLARTIIKSLANIPQEETERKHGKWIFQRNYTWACSECGTNPTEGMGYVQCKEELFEYCPNCGAYMRGEK